MVLRMKNLDILGVPEQSDFKEGSQKTNIERGLSKKGDLDSL